MTKKIIDWLNDWLAIIWLTDWSLIDLLLVDFDALFD